MKARIKKTGEIVDVYHETQHGTPKMIYKESVLVNSKMWTEDELELLSNSDEHWQDVRERAAIAAMQGIMNFFGSIDYNDTSDKVIVEHTDALIIAKLAVEQADALIKELKKNEL